MKKTIILSFGIFLCLSLHAQYKIKVTFEKGNKGEYIFYAENQYNCPYTVELIFSKLENASPGSASVDIPFQTVVSSGKHRILTLNRIKENIPIDFRYVSRFIKGNLRAKVDTNFVYLLPAKEGKKVRMNRLVSLERILGFKKPIQTIGLTVDMEEGDTVYACRNGVVVQINDRSASTQTNTEFNATENFIEIYHKDGSFANYTLFKDNGIFVAPGEAVIAGQPLGIIGGGNYNRGSHLRFRTYYLYKDNNSEDEYFRPRIKGKAFIPTFHLSPNKDDKPVYNKLYTCEHPEKFILLEMNKAQKKKYSKGYMKK